VCDDEPRELDDDEDDPEEGGEDDVYVELIAGFQ